MNPNYENFCLKLNKEQPKSYALLDGRIKAKEWEEAPVEELPNNIKEKINKLFKQKIYVKGLRKSDVIEPFITYPEKIEDVNNKARKYWFGDILTFSTGTNEVIVYSKAITTVPIDFKLICMRN